MAGEASESESEIGYKRRLRIFCPELRPAGMYLACWMSLRLVDSAALSGLSLAIFVCYSVGTPFLDNKLPLDTFLRIGVFRSPNRKLATLVYSRSDIDSSCEHTSSFRITGKLRA